MYFAIALYGSFRETSGYAWKLPYGHDKGRLESIRALLAPPEDGRKIGSGDLYGGYYVDVSEDLLYAFRFIDGGRDALGREGTVMTDCAIARYSDLLGMNLKVLFCALTLRQMPPGGSMELSMPSEFAFTGSTGPFTTEQILRGEEAERVFRLPSAKFDRNILVGFTMSDGQKEASVKFPSPPAAGPRTQAPPKPEYTPERPQNAKRAANERGGGALSRKIPSFIIPFACGILVGGAITAGICNLPGTIIIKIGGKDGRTGDITSGKKSGGTGSNTTGGEKSGGEYVRRPPIAVKVDSVCLKFPIPENCSWEKTGDKVPFFKSNAVSGKRNLYRWGELSIDDSGMTISFAKGVVLVKRDDGWGIKSGSEADTSGELMISDGVLRITFSPDKQECELYGDYHAADRKTDEACAKLSVRDGCISFELTGKRRELNSQSRRR